jgi:hypothetical protein
MQEKDAVNNPQIQKKPYQKPTARKLTREQALLTLMGPAMMGDEGAMELLEMMFSAPDDKKCA